MLALQQILQHLYFVDLSSKGLVLADTEPLEFEPSLLWGARSKSKGWRGRIICALLPACGLR